MAENLICTLGTSPGIVMEAVLSSGTDTPYSNVYCITTRNNDANVTKVRRELARLGENQVSLTVKTVDGFTDLASQEDHQVFQEALIDFYLEHTDGKPLEDIHVCISGGFKSMSAALQKIAHLFGAGRVFHVFAETVQDGKKLAMPGTLEEIKSALSSGQIRVIELGPEPGRAVVRKNTNAVRSSQNKTTFIDSLLSSADATVENLDRFDALPFSSLAGLDPARLSQLNRPLIEWLDTDLIEEIPKIELHCHLGGFATHGELLRQVREAADFPEKLPDRSEPVFPQGWPRALEHISLNHYRALGDATGSAILSDPGCLEMHLKLLYTHLQKERVAYAEIRCSPNNYTALGHSALQVLKNIQDGFDALMESAEKNGEWVTRVNLIIIVTRKRSGDLSAISRHLALAVTAFNPGESSGMCQVVGVDLAGFENAETRPQYFQTDFDLAHRTGLAVTAHAGENDDVESIWQAVFKLNARRLGHALHLLKGRDLLRAVVERGIGIEMCPFANYQIMGFHPMKEKKRYPLLDYLKHGVKVTVNTDNIGISQAGLSENCRILAEMLPEITLLDLLQLQRNAQDVAFAHHDQKMGIAKLMNFKTFEVLKKYL